MQQKNVLILSVVTVAALAVAAVSLREPGTEAAHGEQGRLFPELSAHINDLTEVRVEKGGKTATLKKEGGKWKLADRGGYPALFEKVKELSMLVADLEIEEAKTAKKANHKQLAVEWPPATVEGSEEGSEAGEAGLVTLRDASGKDLAALVIGKSEWRGSKSKVFARRLNEDQVYLCAPRSTLSVMPEASNWIEKKFVELENDRVQSATIEHADGERVEITRSAVNHTQFTVQNLPEGKSLRYEGVANGVAQALGYGLQLEDVRPVTEIDFAKEPVAKTTFRSVDGLVLVVETAKFEDGTWIKVTAAYDPPPEPAPAEPSPAAESPAGEEGTAATAAEGEQAEGEAKPPAEEKPAEPPKRDVAKEVTELNERLGPWAFEVGSYKTDVLARRMKDLLAEPPAPAEGVMDDGGLEGVLDGMGLDHEEHPAADDEQKEEAPKPVPEEKEDG